MNPGADWIEEVIYFVTGDDGFGDWLAGRIARHLERSYPAAPAALDAPDDPPGSPIGAAAPFATEGCSFVPEPGSY